MGRKVCKLTSCLYLVIITLLCVIVLLLNEKCGLEGRRWLPGKVDYVAVAREDSVAYGQQHRKEVMIKRAVVGYDLNDKEYEYDNETPLIFIGGVPRSGTTLMRAMLDAHPDVRCGEETRVIPRILGMRTNWRKNAKESKRLTEAGIDDYVLDSAVSAFMLEVIAKHGAAAPRLCNKDPFTLKSSWYLSRLFPNSKFILMVRDGRATVNSIISRKVTITGFDLSNHRQCLEKWNQAMKTMYSECMKVGQDRCFPMYYEQLVLHPEKWLKELLGFLQLPWNASVLAHEKLIGQEISLSKVERSSDQIIRPVNTDALTKWVGQFPPDVVRDMASIAPMLQQLGYDPNANPPEYGKADMAVIKKTREIHRNENYWNQRVSNILGPTGGYQPPRSEAARPASEKFPNFENR